MLAGESVFSGSHGGNALGEFRSFISVAISRGAVALVALHPT